jgi:hypothetical protein
MRTFPITLFAGEAVAPGGYSAEAQAYFDKILLETSVDVPTTYPAWAAAVDTGISQLVSAGVWAKIDVIYFAAAPAAGIARIDAKGLFLEADVTAQFIAYQGWVGDGAIGCVDTMFDPAVDGVNYTRNSACVFGYSMDMIAASGTNYAWWGDPILVTYTRDVGTNNHYNGWNINGGYSINDLVVTKPHSYAVNRSSSTDVQSYYDGVLLGSATDSNSDPLSVGTIKVLSQDPVAYTVPWGISVWLAGGSLDSTEQAALASAIDSFVGTVYDYTQFGWLGDDLPQLWDATAIDSGQVDPNADTAAYNIDMTSGLAPHALIDIHVTGNYVMGVWLRGDVAGTVDVFDDASGYFTETLNITDTWAEYTIPFTVNAGVVVYPIFNNLTTATQLFVFQPRIGNA